MNVFVQKIVSELKNDSSINTEPLVKMLAESVDKSISLKENVVSIYNSLKTGLISINENLNNEKLGTLISQFEKNEDTADSKLAKIAKEVDLTAKLNSIKESDAHANPIIQTAVSNIENALAQGTPDIYLCENFISAFSQHEYDPKVKSSVASVKKYLADNKAKLAVLGTIYQMDSMRSPVYAGVSADLKTMLLDESYSADILTVKYGKSVPLVASLIGTLSLIESESTGNFTLGMGNYDTKVSNLITPTIAIENGFMMYTDNRFISVRESSSLVGNESTVHIDSNFKIAEVDPNYVKNSHPAFWEVCEAYVTLGFAKSEDGLGVESNNIKKLKIGLKVNENKSLDLYLNGEKVGTPNSINVSEALALETGVTKSKFSKIVEGISNILNLEFIKEVNNSRTANEALVLNLNNKYFVCEKENSAVHNWKEVNEFELYEYFSAKFNYDISPIFKTKIDEGIARIKQIEEEKKEILAGIDKLEKSIAKLDEAINSNSNDAEGVAKLESIRESIIQTVHGLKKEYIALDLSKKK